MRDNGGMTIAPTDDLGWGPVPPTPSPRDDGRPDAGGPLAWEPVSEGELVALALAADPDAGPGEDAVPVDVYLGSQPSLLPLWYMPRPLARPGSKWRLVVVVAVVAVFLAIEAAGLCSTFGQIAPV